MAHRSTRRPSALVGYAGTIALSLALAPAHPAAPGILAQGLAGMPDLPYRAVPDRGFRPAFGWITEGTTQTTGLPLLYQSALPPSHREIRAWIGFGVVLPQTLVRIVETPDGVRGELYQWWESFADPEEEPSLGVREWLDAAAGAVTCHHRPSGNLRTTVHPGGRRSEAPGWLWACRVAPPPAVDPDWEEVLRGLDSLGAFELPDPSTLDPGGRARIDGTALQVEILVGDVYRTYRYWNPGRRASLEAPRAARASGITELLQRVAASFIRP